MLRLLLLATFLTLRAPVFGQSDRPAWFDSPAKFCAELAARTNGKTSNTKITDTVVPPFQRYRVRLMAPPRKQPAILGKDDGDDPRKFAREVKKEAAKGPDFGGRFAVIRWSCGSECSNAVLADVQTGATYDFPFLGVGACREVTGGHDTLDRRANSLLLVVRGSLEMTYGQYSSGGPCGTFSFRWDHDHWRLLSCRIPD